MLFPSKMTTFNTNIPTESLSTSRRKPRSSTLSKYSPAISRQSSPQFRSQLNPTKAMTSTIYHKSSFQTISPSMISMENLWTTTPTSSQKRKLFKLRSLLRKKKKRLWNLLTITKSQRRNFWSLKTVTMKQRTSQRTI